MPEQGVASIRISSVLSNIKNDPIEISDVVSKEETDMTPFFTEDIPTKIIVGTGFGVGYCRDWKEISNMCFYAVEFVIPGNIIKIKLNEKTELNLTYHLKDGKMVPANNPKNTKRIANMYIKDGDKFPRGMITGNGLLYFDTSSYVFECMGRKFLEYFENKFKEGISFHTLHKYIRIDNLLHNNRIMTAKNSLY
ncbi:hypothetical protein ACFLTH_11100 [Bacteroidota bacterium]